MPTLKWIGKDKVINYHNEVPFRLLNENRNLSVNSNNTGNLLIKGDNLEALEALLPHYYNRVKCIYIDPPYNTGNERWRYNDNVNSPEMKKWLGEVVGSEGEDLCRHDKWLCMMYPRLKLLEELMRKDGIIFVSIDNNEFHNLKILMDDVFDARNFISVFCWHSKYTISNDAKFASDQHEYVLCYAKNIRECKLNLLPRTDEMDKRYSNPDNDARGPWKLTPLHAKSGEGESYSYKFKNGVVWKAPLGRFPRFSQETLSKLEAKNRIWFGKDGKGIPGVKTFLSEVQQGRKCGSLWSYKEVGHTHKANEDFAKIMGKGEFNDPKPIGLIKKCIVLSSDKNDIILDSFAGSGTTGHAVLDLNKEEGGNRKFILVELENEIAENITAERLKRVIQGYSYKTSSGKEVKVEGLGGGFKFLKLGEPLFDRHKQIIGEPSYEDLARYLYFTETRSIIDWEKANRDDWYMGENSGVRYFIIYEGKGENELGEEFLRIAKRYKGKKIVYADALMLDDDDLEEYDIVFKQIPYEIKTF